MNTDFKNLKKNRISDIDKLNQKLKEINSGGYQKDPTYWELTVDKAGNGSALIRFLPAPKGEDSPFVRLFKHSFKGPGGWYVENSLTTFGSGVKDPVSEYNSALWESTKDDDSPARKQARNQKRNLVFTSNIEVVKDPQHPEFDGKVFKYNYGKKIFEKIQNKMNPPEELGDEIKAINPFDFWEGATFRLVARVKDDYRNYDLSEFLTPAPLSNSDEELEKIWLSEYSLQELLDKKNFKSYKELEERLNQVLKTNVTRKAADVEEETISAPQQKSSSSTPILTTETVQESTDDEDEEGLEFFKKLAEED